MNGVCPIHGKLLWWSERHITRVGAYGSQLEAKSIVQRSCLLRCVCAGEMKADCQSRHFLFLFVSQDLHRHIRLWYLKKKKNSFTWLYLNKHVVVYRGPTASKTTLITCRNVCGLTKELQGSSCGYFDARVLAHRRKHATVELWEKNRSLHVFIDVLCCILDSGVFIRTVVRTVSGIFIWLLYSDVHILWKYS